MLFSNTACIKDYYDYSYNPIILTIFLWKNTILLRFILYNSKMFEIYYNAYFIMINLNDTDFKWPLY